MKRRCLVLFSGGLDSMLAVRRMHRQGIEVEAVNFKTVFTCCQDQAGQAARKLGVKLTVVRQEDDYLDLVRRPRWGYGKGANPCVDCRIYMFDRAKHYLQQSGADFLASGEIVGQRPMSQKRRDLDVIAHHSGCDDLLLRPLSAKLLPPTRPEREGWIDREQLYDICGRSRKRLIKIAREFGIEEIPSPSTGCALTEKRFSKKVYDLIEFDQAAGSWDFELLKTGPHFRIDEQTKVVVGRNSDENGTRNYMHDLPEARSSALLRPDGFPGPSVLLLGSATDAAIELAAGMIVRYSTSGQAEGGSILIDRRDGQESISATRSETAEQLVTLAGA